MGAYTVVTPQGTQVLGFIGIRQGLGVSLRHITADRIVVFIQLGHTGDCGNVIGVAQVKTRRTGHGQDPAGIDIHNDAGAVIEAVSFVPSVSELLI